MITDGREWFQRNVVEINWSGVFPVKDGRDALLVRNTVVFKFSPNSKHIGAWKTPAALVSCHFMEVELQLNER